MSRSIRVRTSDTDGCSEQDAEIISQYMKELQELAEYLEIPRRSLGMFNVESQLPAAHVVNADMRPRAVTVAVAALEAHMIGLRMAQANMVILEFSTSTPSALENQAQAKVKAQSLALWLGSFPASGNLYDKVNTAYLEGMIIALHERAYLQPVTTGGITHG